MKIYRIFVEKKDNLQAKKVKEDIRNLLGIKVADVRTMIRYDVEGMTQEEFDSAVPCVFSEPPVDCVYYERADFGEEYNVFAVAYLTGQYDQRADSASQCVQLLTQKERPLIKCATVYAVSGVGAGEITRIKKHLINPVECEEVSLDKPESLAHIAVEAESVKVLEGFIAYTDEQIADYHAKIGLAMSVADLAFVRDYFKGEGRNPTETEIKVIDTYWSDHCRHTTFATELKNIQINSDNKHVNESLELYKNLFKELYKDRDDKYPCLMDIATIAVKKLKKEGKLNNLDESDEINACSIKVDAVIDGEKCKYTVMIKNQTHNHPT